RVMAAAQRKGRPDSGGTRGSAPSGEAERERQEAGSQQKGDPRYAVHHGGQAETKRDRRKSRRRKKEEAGRRERAKKRERKGEEREERKGRE
ncbi:hypothetical protein O4E68_26370, partial [Escherichia coli]